MGRVLFDENMIPGEPNAERVEELRVYRVTTIHGHHLTVLAANETEAKSFGDAKSGGSK